MVSFFYLSIFFFFLAESQRPQVGCLPYSDTWSGPSTNLECRSERCCTRLAANAGPKKVAKNRHLGTIPQLCRAISLQLRHVSSTIGKKLVKQQYFLYMSLQYGELRPTSGWDRFVNGLRVLAALLHGTLVVGVSQTAALNRGRHLHSAGRPSRWALTHISSYLWDIMHVNSICLGLLVREAWFELSYCYWNNY